MSKFSRKEALLAPCFYNDCRHNQEPGCAVKTAIQDGLLSADRFLNYQKLQRELLHIEQKLDGRRRAMEKERGRAGSKFRKELKNRGTHGMR